MASKRKYNPDRRPREMVFDAQERCFEWIEVCQNAHMGLGQVNPGGAERALHNAVMSYWMLLQQYRDEPQLDGMWGEKPLSEHGPLKIGSHDVTTLADCRELPFGVEVLEETKRDAVEGTKHVQTEVPAHLSMAQSVDVLLALNDAAHQLGFMADPKVKEAPPQPV